MERVNQNRLRWTNDYCGLRTITLFHDILILPGSKLRKTIYRRTGVPTYGIRCMRPTLYLLHHSRLQREELRRVLLLYSLFIQYFLLMSCPPTFLPLGWNSLKVIWFLSRTLSMEFFYCVLKFSFISLSPKTLSFYLQFLYRLFKILFSILVFYFVKIRLPF